MPKFCFGLISWEHIDIFSPNFIYAFILTRYTLRLLQVIFPIFVPKFWPLIYIQIWLPLNILEFHQILYMHSDWQDLQVIFPTFYLSYCPWFTSKFPFHSISWEQIDIFLPNFIYGFILTRSSLGLLHVLFRTFVPELWSLIYTKISFPLNILKTIW